MSNSTRNEKIESRVDDRNAEWFLASGGKDWIGPLTLAAIVRKLLRHEISPAHLVWKKGLAQWQRLQDTQEFRSVLREMPPSHPEMAGRQAQRREWHLYLGEKQFGPYAVEEVVEFIRGGKVDGRAFAWRHGMAGWERLPALEQFSRYFPAVDLPPPAPPVSVAESARIAREVATRRNAENRGAPRRPLVAKILFTNDESVIEASCKDISEGGMLVVTNQPGSLPCEVGDKIRLNVSPLDSNHSEDGANGNRIKAFVAEGRIVRTLNDGNGFSFRFEKLSENAKRAIEAFIHSAA